MHDTLTTPLPGSWLASRLGVHPREIERLRESGELFAVRGQEEWLYPAWQFGPGGGSATAKRSRSTPLETTSTFPRASGSFVSSSRRR